MNIKKVLSIKEKKQVTFSPDTKNPVSPKKDIDQRSSVDDLLVPGATLVVYRDKKSISGKSLVIIPPKNMLPSSQALRRDYAFGNADEMAEAFGLDSK